MAILVDCYAAATGLGVKPGTIRNWASDGHLQAKATHGKRRLYDFNEIRRVAARPRKRNATLRSS